jgi:hypothetical protein
LPPRVYRLDAKSGQVTIVADDFDKPNGLAFSPDEKKLYTIDTGLTHSGRSNMRVFDVDSDRLSNGKVFAENFAPDLRMACAPTWMAMYGAAWAKPIPRRTVCVATRRAAISSERSISRRPAPICALAARSGTVCS